MTATARFDDRDRADLAARGLSEAAARAQLERLAAGPRWTVLERPCTPGDGIERLADARVDALLAAHARAAAAARVTAFTPASGAATRMFRELSACRAHPGPLAPSDVRARAATDGDARALVAFVDGLPALALRDGLARALADRGESLDALRERGPWRPLLDALLDAGGLDAARRPKGLLPFHRTSEGPRTAFEEHLEDAVALTTDASLVRRLHVTVPPGHRAEFEAAFAARGPALQARHGGRFAIAFSEQSPATDTLAADPGGGPFRDADGRLLFRPAGHGALIGNLGACGADLAFVRNIDNVAAAPAHRDAASRWARALVGLAAERAALARALAARLADPGDAGAAGEAVRFLAGTFGVRTEGLDRAALAGRLDRPVRVCGMVPNTGEPGGGPFWVRGRDGEVTPQIVETSQVNAGDAGQQSRLRAATHFNPVFLACALRDGAGRPYDLARFVDPDTAIVTRKSHAGRDLLALERPGLWNGAMAGWLTSFVEVPLAVFNPVKSVLDLMRPEHQPA